MNIGLILIIGVIGSFVFLSYAIYSYLQDASEDKKSNLNQEENNFSKPDVLVEPYVEIDTASNTAVLTLQNGMKKTLSPIDLALHQRGVTGKQLNDEYMLRLS